MERSQVFIGTGGWEHDVLDQCLYPQSGMTSNQKLAYYARFFGTTEVRATFWDESIAAADARGLAEAVEGRHDFLFNVKLHKAFTHKRELHSSMAKNNRGVLQELARHNKLGALLLQFPYGFTNTGAGRQHLVKLAE